MTRRVGLDRSALVVDLMHPTDEQRQVLTLVHAESGDRRFNPTKKLLIWALWKGGADINAIAEELRTTPNALGVAMVRMRKEGWPLPYRPSYPRRMLGPLGAIGPTIGPRNGPTDPTKVSP